VVTPGLRRRVSKAAMRQALREMEYERRLFEVLLFQRATMAQYRLLSDREH
jgi:hypothetical protein